MKSLMAKVFLGAALVTSAFAADVDLSKSDFTWHGEKVTGKHHGKILMKSASVEMKDGKLSGGTFVADMSSFTVTDLEGEWADKFLGHMKSDDFFSVSKYPTSTLNIKSVSGKTATADLTIKGKTHEVKFDLAKADKTYSGVLKFDRTKFGMVYNSGNFFKDLGDKVINDEVKVDFKFVVK